MRAASVDLVFLKRHFWGSSPVQMRKMRSELFGLLQTGLKNHSVRSPEQDDGTFPAEIAVEMFKFPTSSMGCLFAKMMSLFFRKGGQLCPGFGGMGQVSAFQDRQESDPQILPRETPLFPLRLRNPLWIITLASLLPCPSASLAPYPIL